MENIGEKIKAFTSDREKVQALASDATFMNKVSGGSVTPEDTMKKFSELGLPLTTEDAQTVNKTTSNILTAIPSLKLNDEILDNVSGSASPSPSTPACACSPPSSTTSSICTSDWVWGGTWLGCWSELGFSEIIGFPDG